MACIREAREVHLCLGNRTKSYSIPNKALIFNDNGVFLGLTPKECRNIALLITSRCSSAVRNSIVKMKKAEQRKLWRAEAGKDFLNYLGQMRYDAIHKMFHVKGNRRLTTRKTVERAQQFMAEQLTVQLPRAGDRPGVEATMMMYSKRHGRAGRGSTTLSVLMEEEAIDHITHLAKEFFSSQNPSEPSSQEISADDDSSDDDASADDKHVQDAEHRATAPPLSVSPIMAAFARGAKIN